MSFDSVAVLCSDFPDPDEQAKAILEICDENVQIARSLVWTRLRFARTVEEIHYWVQVERVLAKRASTFEFNTPSDEQAHG
jgi:hypothetical protein